MGNWTLALPLTFPFHSVSSTVKGKTLSNPDQQEKQQGSKYVRPCCRPPPHQQKRVLVDRVPCARPNLPVGGCPQKASDNVNQSDNEKPLETHPIEQPTERYYEYGSVEDGQRQQNAKSVTTGSWDGMLTSTGTRMSLSQIKSKVSEWVAGLGEVECFL